MGNRLKLNSDITIGPQPSDDELKQLGNEGFKTVINLRVPHEEEGMLEPVDEAAKVREHDLSYLNIPVSGKQLRPAQVDEFRNAVEKLDKPIFVHCKSGKRAGAFSMMHMAVQQGWSGEETLKKAEEMGFECDQPQLVEFVKSYVDEHR